MATDLRNLNTLPPELQAQIWRCTFPEGRIVKVRRDENGCYRLSGASLPIALGICYASRREVLAAYKRLHFTDRKGIYLHPALDTIYLATHETEMTYETSVASFPQASTIQSLAFDLGSLSELQEKRRAVLLRCKISSGQIKKVTFVATKSSEGCHDKGKDQRDVVFKEPESDPRSLGWGYIWTCWGNAEKTIRSWIGDDALVSNAVVRSMSAEFG